MYLTEPRLIDVVKKQFRFKLNAYTGVFISLIVMQLIGIFLSFESSSGGMSGSEPLMITWSTSMNETPIVFTWVWAFSMGILTDNHCPPQRCIHVCLQSIEPPSSEHSFSAIDCFDWRDNGIAFRLTYQINHDHSKQFRHH